jgi:hypothetical protein
MKELQVLALQAGSPVSNLGTQAALFNVQSPVDAADLLDAAMQVIALSPEITVLPPELCILPPELCILQLGSKELSAHDCDDRSGRTRCDWLNHDRHPG